jgi:hypothetical protein
MDTLILASPARNFFGQGRRCLHHSFYMPPNLKKPCPTCPTSVTSSNYDDYTGHVVSESCPHCGLIVSDDRITVANITLTRETDPITNMPHVQSIRRPRTILRDFPFEGMVSIRKYGNRVHGVLRTRSREQYDSEGYNQRCYGYGIFSPINRGPP